MRIDNISPPRNSDEVGEYISSCERDNVMPFSCLGLRNLCSVFLLHNARSSIPEFASVDLYDSLALHVAKGGRPYRVDFKANGNDNKQLFRRFRDKFFDTFLNQGYNVRSGEMYVGSPYMYCHLLLSRDGERFKQEGVYANFNEGMTEIHRTNVEEWLDGLREKYDSR